MKNLFKKTPLIPPLTIGYSTYPILPDGTPLVVKDTKVFHASIIDGDPPQKTIDFLYERINKGEQVISVSSRASIQTNNDLTVDECIIYDIFYVSLVDVV